MVREAIVIALLGLAVLVVLISSIGLWAMDDVFDRLHFLGPLTLATILVAIAVVVEEGFSAAGAKSLLVAAGIAIFNPILSHATARAARVRQYGHWVPMPEERSRR